MKSVLLLVAVCAGLTVTIQAQRPVEQLKDPVTDNREVCVLGNVANPSAIAFKEKISLTEAIERAGGALPNLKANRVIIVRRLPNGYVQPISVKHLNKKGPTLEANDIIDVFPKRRTQKVSSVTPPPCGAWWVLLRRTM